MSQNIISSFQRYEVKFFLTPQQREHLMPELEAHFKIDQYGLHTISNIYYDTDDYAITRDSIDRPVYKEKLRVRAYGVPKPETGQVFVELKKKYDHVVYKRRIAVPIGEANRFLQGDRTQMGQIRRLPMRFVILCSGQSRSRRYISAISELPWQDWRIRIYALPWIRSCYGGPMIWTCVWAPMVKKFCRRR